MAKSHQQHIIGAFWGNVANPEIKYRLSTIFLSQAKRRAHAPPTYEIRVKTRKDKLIPMQITRFARKCLRVCSVNVRIDGFFILCLHLRAVSIGLAQKAVDGAVFVSFFASLFCNCLVSRHYVVPFIRVFFYFLRTLPHSI